MNKTCVMLCSKTALQHSPKQLKSLGTRLDKFQNVKEKNMCVCVCVCVCVYSIKWLHTVHFVLSKFLEALRSEIDLDRHHLLS